MAAISLALLFVSVLSAQSPLSTGFAGTYTLGSGNVYFDMTVYSPITLQSIDVNTSSDVGTVGNIALWMTKPGTTTYAGSEYIMTRWSVIGMASCVSAGPGQPSTACFQVPPLLQPGTYGFAVGYLGLRPQFSRDIPGFGSGQQPGATYETDELALTPGTAQELPFISWPLTWSSFNGSLVYYSGSQSFPCDGNPAINRSEGEGCYRRMTSFWDYFDPIDAGSTLNEFGISMLPTGEGYVLQGQYGPGYQAPTAQATTLTGFIPNYDDGEVLVELPGPLTLGNGIVTNRLFVHTNGIISTGLIHSSLASSRHPHVQDLLDTPHMAWFSWHDYKPNEPYSGAIVTELIGSLFCITWDGVESASTAQVNPSTFQMQFDLDSGQVHYYWKSISPIYYSFKSSDHLIGYSNGGDSLNHGETSIVNLHAEVLFDSGDQRPLELVASPRPVLGHSVAYVTLNPPGTSGVGVCLMSQENWIGMFGNGIDLWGIGASGCTAYLHGQDGIASLIGTSPSIGRQVDLDIPINYALVGLSYSVQSAWLDATQNAAGFVVSNVIESVVGAY